MALRGDPPATSVHYDKPGIGHRHRRGEIDARVLTLQYSSLKNSMDYLLQCNYNTTLNSLTFVCLILPLFLKDIFTGYRILC